MLIDSATLKEPIKPKAGSTLNNMRKAELIKEDADDVAPVVRCKDCKHWQDNNGGYPHEECRWGHGETPDANDFCSYGERREK